MFMVMSTIFITGGTGYIGSRLISRLVQKGHRVIALVRKGSKNKLQTGAEAIVADPFDASSFRSHIPAQSVFVQLLGVPHPSPKKAQQFRAVDLKSVKASADAAAETGVLHFIYAGVAMSESKLMKAFQDVRKEGEAYCRAKKLNCTFIRPWYVLGPGHWWPVVLLPFYAVAELVPLWRQRARAKALVTINQMLDTLVRVIKLPPQPLRIVEISRIRKPETIT